MKVAGYDEAVKEAIRQEEAHWRAMLRLQHAKNNNFILFKKLGRPKKGVAIVTTE